MSDDEDDGTAGSDPDRRSFYYYDANWQLLEEVVDESYTGTWTWVGPGGAWVTLPDSAGVFVHQYIYDPTASDELVQFRSSELGATGWATSGGSGGAYWGLTDRRHNLVGLLDANAASETEAYASLQRVRYSSYGVPTPVVRSDVDGDGDVDTDDLAFFSTPYNGAVYGSANYRADADINGDGVIDNSDVALYVADFNAQLGVHEGGLWNNACAIGYAGSVYDPAVQLALMRNRWYDAELGRWITRDPAGYIDGMSLYMYVSGNPLLYYDPFGLKISYTIIETERDNKDVFVVHSYDDGLFGLGIMAKGFLGTSVHERNGDPATDSHIRSVLKFEHTLSIAASVVEDSVDTGVAAGEIAVRTAAEPVDTVLSVRDIIRDPKDPLNYAGLLPIVPGGLGKLAKTTDDASTSLRRPYIRKGTRAEVEANAPRTPDGRPIDPNTRQPIDGKPDIGHKTGEEYWRQKKWAEEQGMSQEAFNDFGNNADNLQLEDRSSNRSRKFEDKSDGPPLSERKKQESPGDESP